MLKKDYVRDGEGRTIGSVTTGLSGGTSIVRDEKEKVIGRTSEQFHTTRDELGKLISGNTSDAGLLFRKK